jgi:hypothetical protein
MLQKNPRNRPTIMAASTEFNNMVTKFDRVINGEQDNSYQDQFAQQSSADSREATW